MKKLDFSKGPSHVFAKTCRRSLFKIAQELITDCLHKRVIMRINFALLLVISLGMQVQATVSYGQEKLTIHEKNVPLQKILDDVRDQTGMSYGGKAIVVGSGHLVSISVTDATLKDVLDMAFEDQPYTYEILGKMIAIKGREGAVGGPGDGKVVKAVGVVMNEAGEPLAGANVTDKQMGRGTITNVKGEFQLSNVPVNATLVISYVGYAPQSIKVKDAAIFQVYLVSAKNELDKVVIQAYGTTTQRLNTGNIATVTAAQIERQPIMNPLEALQGQVPGVVVQETNGYASAPFKVEIRGRSVIDPSLPSDPLYIVDGVPLTTLNSPYGGNYASGSTGVSENGFEGPAGGQSPFFSINPADIESITVLKDADATAIYGSRGANGVILLTTKKGKPGKTKLTANVYSGESAITQHYSLMNTTQYLAMRREAFKNDGITPTVSNAYDMLVWDTTRNTDWQKFFLGGIGKTTDVQTSLDGGDQLTTFRIGGAYHRQTSILNYSGADQRGSVQFNLIHKSQNRRLNLSFTSYYAYTQSNLISFPSSLLLPPDAPPILNSEGMLNFSGWAPSRNVANFGSIFQPYVGKTGFLNSTLSLDYEILKGLKISARLGYSTTHQSQTGFDPIIAQDPLNNPTGTSQFGNNNNANAIIEPDLEYNRLIGRGKLAVLFGGSTQSVTQDGNNVFGTGYVNDHLLSSISNAPTVSSTDVNLQYKYAAAFGRINYNWDDKYIINFSARRDGSSRFGSGRQYGNFGAVGAAWIFTEEGGWFKNHLPSLSFGKVRGSYGLTGNDDILDYEYLSTWSANAQIPYQMGIPVYLPTQLANPGLHWQTNRKLELAMDLGFLKDRITLEAVWYRNLCGDQLTGYPLPIITGFSGVEENLPATIQNTGVEGNFRAKLINTKALEWSINFNIGANYNKLVAYPNLAQSSYASVYYLGKPLNLVPLLHYTGIDPLTGRYTFLDKNKDGVLTDYGNVNSNDMFLHDLSIRPDGGFGTDLRYKGFQLNAFFTFRRQFIPSASFSVAGVIGDNQSTQVLNRWQNPGDIAEFARYTTKLSTGGALGFSSFKESDAYYSNGSYIRLKNLSLSYSLQSAWSKKAGLDGTMIYIHAENLFVLTKYNGIDPDTPGIGGLPPAKTLTLGVQFHL